MKVIKVNVEDTNIRRIEENRTDDASAHRDKMRESSSKLPTLLLQIFVLQRSPFRA